MGLLQPSGLSVGHRSKRLFNITAWNSRLILGRLCFLLVLLLAVAVVLHFIKNAKSDDKPQKATVTSSDTLGKINYLKNSQNLDDIRNVKLQYLSAGDYNNALDTAKKIASKTQDPQDYLEVLRISSVYSVNSKEAEISSAVVALKPKVNSLTFRQSYAAGNNLEYAKHNKDAAFFYQHAYDTYDETQKDPYTMSKTELKSHIGGL
jgi:hypothetical protein